MNTQARMAALLVIAAAFTYADNATVNRVSPLKRSAVPGLEDAGPEWEAYVEQRAKIRRLNIELDTALKNAKPADHAKIHADWAKKNKAEIELLHTRAVEANKAARNADKGDRAAEASKKKAANADTRATPALPSLTSVSIEAKESPAGEKEEKAAPATRDAGH